MRYVCMYASVYFALVHPTNVYHLSSRLQYAVEKSKTAKQNSQKHRVSQTTVWIWNEIPNR
jgi:hypothetical protein